MSGLGRDFAPIADAAGGTVVLAATGRGAVVSVGWPGAGGGAGAAESGGGRGSGGGEGGARDADAEAAAAARTQAPREARLHAGRVTAMALLPSLGLLFTAGANGVVIMSRVSLVIDGSLVPPPPVWSPAALAAAAVCGGALPPGGAGGAAAAPGGPPPPELRLVSEAAYAALADRVQEAAAQLRAQGQDVQYQVGAHGGCLPCSAVLYRRGASALSRLSP